MQQTPPVAIVGMSALFAGSDDLLGFWRDIVSATDRLTDVPPHAWLIEDYYDPDPSVPDMTYAKRGGFLTGVPFDSMEFGIPPTAIPATDSAQLLALIAAKRVLADAARFREGGEIDRSRTSVILGVASATELVVQMGSRLQHPIWRKALRDAGLAESKVQEVIQRIGDHYQPWQESTFPGLLGNVVAGRIANRLDLGGSNFVTDAACASSISALQAGLSELYLGDSDTVIAGGVDALNDILMYMCFSKTPAFSPTGDCRPFSAEADGTLIGEGVGMLALRRLEDAERDGDPIYAVIRGLGASSDGRGSSVYAPRPEGQAKALQRAYDRAGYSPATVELVEAHGTATKAGDAAEARGLTSVFGPADPEGRAWCALGSVKSQIGHTKAAAGSAGLIKVALALHHKVLPPTLKVSKPNPQLGLEDGPLYINTETRPWIRGSDHPRRGSVSSFGFGGSNFHVTVEEYTGPGRRPPRLRTWSEELVLFSDETNGDLVSSLARARERVEAGEAIARLAADGADAFDASAPVRLAIVAADGEEFVAKAENAAAALTDGTIGSLPDPDILFGSGDSTDGRTAFLFPGQGSQYVGMGAGAATTFDTARAVWDAAADMEVFADGRLDRAVFPPPAFTDEERAEQRRRLTEMDTAQPAIAAVSLGYLRLMRDLGVTPDAVAGHSFGEVTALAAAGRLTEDDLLAVARTRGRLMAEAAAASREGTMLAVSSDAATVGTLVGDLEDVVVANDNAPNEVVLAGPVEAIARAEELLRESKISSMRIPVASAFHSSIVADSCEPFHQHLGSVEWAEGSLDVYANTTAEPYPSEPDAARRLLADQLASPVRFREMVDAMYDAGVRRFVEVGPGRVLTKLVGRCLGERSHVAVALDHKNASGLRAFWRGLGRLAADGVALDLGVLAEGYRVPDAPLEPKKHQILVTGANHDKPYPPVEGAAGLPGPNPERAEQQPSSNAPAAVERSVAARLPDAGVPARQAASPPAAPRAVAPSAPRAPAAGNGVTPDTAQASAPRTAGDPEALADVHRATIDAHRRYQELMADSHRSFLEMAADVADRIAGGGPVRRPAAPERAPRSASPTRSTPAQIPVAPARPVTPSAPSVASSGSTPEPVAAHAAETVAPAATSSPAPQPTGGVSPAPAKPAVDVTALALEVVSEKTGYPVDMLDLDMEMEAGLGIDSIKQVEILSELQERLPEMPEIAPSELAELRTLRDVADKLGAAGTVRAAAPTTAATSSPAAEPTGGVSPAPTKPAVDVTALALQVVSEKTGYPVEMLDLDMEMEAGLGIDSIKQVEILSELQERLPEMPEIAPSELAELRTLRDVANKLRPGLPVSDETTSAGSEGATRASAVPSVPVAQKETPIAAFVPTVVPELRPGFGLAALSRGAEVQVTNELPSLAEALAEGLRERGVDAQVVDSVGPTAGVISLAGLIGGELGPDASVEVHTRAIQAARIVAQHPDPSDRLFVTVQSTGGGFGLSGDPGDQAWLGGLSGIVKTAAREWPGASLKAIDVEDPENAAQEILDELFHGGPAVEVGITADRVRGVVRIDPLSMDGATGPALAPGSVLVVSGGARGVTASSVARLAEAWGLKLALLGRSQLGEWPEGVPLSTDAVQLTGALASAAKEKGETIDLGEVQRRAQSLAASAEVRLSLADLDARGIETLYLSADVTDPTQVALALEHVRETLGPIAGIVHGAGVLRDKSIAETTPDRVADVFAPKVRGLGVLLDATRDDSIELIALFSSIAARSGNAGQVAYAAANEVLNKVAAREVARRGEGCRVRSYNWGPWAGGMVDAGLAAHFEKQGIALLSIEAGTRFFVEEMGLGGDGVERVVLAAPAFPRHTHRLTFAPTDSAEGEEPLFGVAPALVADFALRLGQALKPVHTMRMQLKDFVVGKLTGSGDGSPDRVHVVDISPAETDEPGYRLVFRDADGNAQHETLVLYSDSGREPPPSVPSDDLEPWPMEARAAYETVLANSGGFQSIETLEGVSEEGGMALLKSARSLGWPPKGFARGFDPATLEGLLQLGALWTHQKSGAMQRLARMGSMAVYHLETIPERLRSAFRARRTDTGTLFDFILATEDGDLVAELREVEFDTQSA